MISYADAPQSFHKRMKSATRFGPTETLVVYYQETRGDAVRMQILHRFTPLVYKLAARHATFRAPIEDLIQEGRIGLLRAIEQYDESRECSFASYATRRISSSIEHYVRDHARLIRQPAWVQERNQRIARETERLRSRLGREPRASEVARSLEIPEEQVVEASRLRLMSDLDSLDLPMGEEGSPTPGETIAAEGSPSATDSFPLRHARKALTPIESVLIDLVYYQGLSQREAADATGLSQGRARYVLESALRRLARELQGETAAR